MKYFLSYEHQVYFKFIDFGDALFMKGDNFEKYTKRIIKIRKKIPGILYN